MAFQPTPTPSKDLKDIVKRFSEEAWVKGNPDIIDEILSHDFIYHDPAMPAIDNRELYKRGIISAHSLFKNIQYEIKDMIMEGEKIAVRYIFSADYKVGRVSHDGIAIYLFANNCVMELWDFWDAAGLKQQRLNIDKQIEL